MNNDLFFFFLAEHSHTPSVTPEYFRDQSFEKKIQEKPNDT